LDKAKANATTLAAGEADLIAFVSGLTASWRGLMDKKPNEMGQTREIRISFAGFLVALFLRDRSSFHFGGPIGALWSGSVR
jgi:hypothetical protein